MIIYQNVRADETHIQIISAFVRIKKEFAISCKLDPKQIDKENLISPVLILS